MLLIKPVLFLIWQFVHIKKSQIVFFLKENGSLYVGCTVKTMMRALQRLTASPRQEHRVGLNMDTIVYIHSMTCVLMPAHIKTKRRWSSSIYIIQTQVLWITWWLRLSLLSLSNCLGSIGAEYTENSLKILSHTDKRSFQRSTVKKKKKTSNMVTVKDREKKEGNMPWDLS